MGREGQVVALNALLAAAWWYLKHGVAFLSLLDGGAMLRPGPARWLAEISFLGHLCSRSRVRVRVRVLVRFAVREKRAVTTEKDLPVVRFQ